MTHVAADFPKGVMHSAVEEILYERRAARSKSCKRPQPNMLPRGNPWVTGWANGAVVRGSGETYGRWIQRSVAAPPSRSDTAAALPLLQHRRQELRPALF